VLQRIAAGCSGLQRVAAGQGRKLKMVETGGRRQQTMRKSGCVLSEKSRVGPLTSMQHLNRKTVLQAPVLGWFRGRIVANAEQPRLCWLVACCVAAAASGASLLARAAGIGVYAFKKSVCRQLHCNCRCSLRGCTRFDMPHFSMVLRYKHAGLTDVCRISAAHGGGDGYSQSCSQVSKNSHFQSQSYSYSGSGAAAPAGLIGPGSFPTISFPKIVIPRITITI